uniref:CRAL-TRIO domain-containing protein n=1 Tax=Strigamia maritima TaxID=126957 RepID=T1IYM4_STRMM
MSSFNSFQNRPDNNAELLNEAEQESHETQEWRDREIQKLKNMVLGERDLNSRMDDAFLLRFLRARKFNSDRAFQLLKNYYKIRQQNPQLYKNFRPSALRSIYAHNLQTMLPDRDQLGRKVFIFKVGKWIPELCSTGDLYRACQMCAEITIEEEKTQINGFVCIADLKDFGIHQIRHITPAYLKRFALFLHNGFPARFKGLHAVNENVIFDMLVLVCKPFFSKKLQKRVMSTGCTPWHVDHVGGDHLRVDQMHVDHLVVDQMRAMSCRPFACRPNACRPNACRPNACRPNIMSTICLYCRGKDMTSLHRHICAEILPREFGGAKPPMDNSEFVREMLAKDDEFYESTKINLDDAFLLRFLRAQKFNYDRAFQLLKNYYKTRSQNAQLCMNFSPSALTGIYAYNMQTVPADRDHLGRKVFIFNAESHYTPTYMKRTAALIHDYFPGRFKGFHFVNENAIFHTVFLLIKPFFSEERIHFHANDMTSLHRHVSADILPQELGGAKPSMDNSEFVREMLAKNDDFYANTKY